MQNITGFGLKGFIRRAVAKVVSLFSRQRLQIRSKDFAADPAQVQRTAEGQTIMGVKITKDRLPEVRQAIRALTSKEILVGVPKESAERDPEPGEIGKPIDNASIGYIMEFGAPEANIPPRPFLIPGVETVLDQVTARMKKAAQQALEGDASKIDAQMTAVGLIAAAAVQQKIVDGPFAPLKPLTIAKRQAKGRTGTKPLIDTRALQQSITYVVAKKER